jgi:polyisoprenoid-binding protein YceI
MDLLWDGDCSLPNPMRERAEPFVHPILRSPIFAVVFFFFILFFVWSSRLAACQEISLNLDSQHTSINFTLGDVLHTIHGTFELKRGDLQFDATSGKLRGEIVVDAKSGQSSNAMRDRKMHREVLESDRFPEIAFHLDHVDGAVSLNGKSSVRVHGMFSIHGSEHELTVPAEVEILPDHWTATLHFAVPYAKWGMKNPSTLFLRVNDSVEIDLNASGSVTR